MKQAEAPTVCRRLRVTSISILLLGIASSTIALAYQLTKWAALERGDLGGVVKMLLLLWSPYLGLLVLFLLLGRNKIRAAILLVSSVLVTAWGIYWHLDILWLDPSTVAQILSPLLITGNQWIGVGVFAVLAWVGGWLGTLLRREPEAPR